MKKSELCLKIQEELGLAMAINLSTRNKIMSDFWK